MVLGWTNGKTSRHRRRFQSANRLTASGADETGSLPKAAKVRPQREPDMLLVQELAGASVTGSSADLRLHQTKTQSICSKGPGAIRPATTSTLLDDPASRWTNGQDPGMAFKNSTLFRLSLSPCSPRMDHDISPLRFLSGIHLARCDERKRLAPDRHGLACRNNADRETIESQGFDAIDSFDVQPALLID